MSLYDYQQSQVIASVNYDFYALLMATMMQADSENTEKFKAMWPDVWKELYSRYNAPGGIIDDDELKKS